MARVPGMIVRCAAGGGLAMLLLLPAGVSAQQGDCCFINMRHTGVCRVVQGPDDSCMAIQAYLNSPSSTGKAYCGSTVVRGGWRQVPCPRVESGGVHMTPSPHQSQPPTSAPPATQPQSLRVFSSPAWVTQTSWQPDARPVTPVVVPPGSTVQLSMDEGLDLASASPGRSFAAHLDADLKVGDTVLASRGSPVYGRVVQTSAGRQTRTVFELTDITVDGQLTPLVSNPRTNVPVGLPVQPAMKTLETNGRVAADPTVALLLTGDVTGALELTRAAIEAERQNLVATNMGLTDAEGEVFWPLYREYSRAMAEVGDRRLVLITTYAEHYPDVGDDRAEVLLHEAMAIDKQELAVRRTYLKRLAKVLPATKVARFYQIENKLDAAVAAELTAQIPLMR